MIYVERDRDNKDDLPVSLNNEGDGRIQLLVGNFYLATVVEDEDGIYLELNGGIDNASYQTTKDGYIKTVKE